MARPQDTVVLDTTKVLRDLVILAVVIAGIYFAVGAYQRNQPQSTVLVDPRMPAGHPTVNAPETNPAVDPILALLDPDSPTVLATIDEMEVTQGMVDGKAANLLTRGVALADETLKPEAQRDSLRVQAFYDISREIAKDRAALARGLEPTDEAVEAAIAKSQSGFPTEQDFIDALASMGTDLEGMRALQRRNLRDQMLQTAVVAELGGATSDIASQEQLYADWLLQQMASIPTEVVDPEFQETITRWVTMMQAAPEHAPGGAAGAARGDAVPHDHDGDGHSDHADGAH